MLDDDVRLFLDPCRIEADDHPLASRCNRTIQSFFDAFFLAYKNGDRSMKIKLLSHAREQNSTRLGYGLPGKGNSQEGLDEKFQALSLLVPQISTMKKAQDLPVLLSGFAEDGLSDLLTNIIHEDLNDYTLEQMQKHGIAPNGITSFYTWNADICDWARIEAPCFKPDGKPIMLVPKVFVRPSYLFSTTQYFERIILDRIRAEGGGVDTAGKLIPKRYYRDHFVPRETPHWLYDYVVRYSKVKPDALYEYHEKTPGFYYFNGKALSDEELDRIVYRISAVA